MESTVISPNPSWSGQTVVSTDHDRRFDYDEWDQAILREQAAGFRDAVQSREAFARMTARNHVETVISIKDARFDIVQTVDHVAAELRLEAERNKNIISTQVFDLRVEMQKEQCATRMAVLAEGNATRDLLKQQALDAANAKIAALQSANNALFAAQKPPDSPSV